MGSAAGRQIRCPTCDDLSDLLLATRVHVIPAIDQSGRHSGCTALVTLHRGDDGIEIGLATNVVARPEEGEQGDAHARDRSIGPLHAEEVARRGVGEERVDVQKGRGAYIGRKIPLGVANERVTLAP